MATLFTSELEEGMVTTNEPGVYVENSHGIRIENEIVVRKAEKNEYGQFMDFEVITFAPIDLDAIDESLILKDEKVYLNNYHKQVYDKISPYLNEEAIYIYTGVFHNISVGYLPQIWAECDDKRADQNPVAAKVTADGSNLFVIDRKDFIPDENGNYLRIHISSDCDAEDVVITIGKSDKGEFEERYRYQITVSEGVHDYLIRVSTDYYWYTDSVNAISVQSDVELSDVSMSILAGD